MTAFDGAREHDQPLPLWVEILGGAVWAGCVIAWTAIIVAIGVLI